VVVLALAGLFGCGDDDAVGADGDASASGDSGSADATVGAYSTLVVNLGVTAGEDGIALEANFIDLLEAQLVNGLLGQLGTTGFGQFSLPTIDLSGMLGLPAGTAVLEIHVDGVHRTGGTTVIAARF